jgi:hypothetical protein
VVSRETSVSPEPEPTLIGLRLVVDDVTPAIDRSGTPPPPMALPPEADQGPEVDDVPLYVAATRGLDWGIGTALGEQYRATPDHLDTVAEAAAPLARRLADLIGAAEAVDSTVPPIIRELVTFGAAVYVAWGDAAELAIRAGFEAYRHRGEDDADASAEDRPAGAADRGARGRDRGSRRVAGPAGRVGGAAEAAQATRPLGPPGPGEDGGADLAASFAVGRALGSGTG